MKLLFIGAHPDDCEVFGGGTAALFAASGHQVKFISMTMGDAGHQFLSASELVERRSRESLQAASVLGVSYEILDQHDGMLQPDPDLRMLLIRKIREWEADMVFTHRPNDYHPDHRYTSQIVQDAAYMVMVPAIAPEVPPLRKNPLFLYFEDRFRKPYPFHADLAVGIDEVVELKLLALDAHRSQFYEWLPWVEGKSAEIPVNEEERKKWLRKNYIRQCEEKDRQALSRCYGDERAARFVYAECFEICEYGYQPKENELAEFFPGIF
jgi:LmbE family N-acetylglucosaminyl deacetylase